MLHRFIVLGSDIYNALLLNTSMKCPLKFILMDDTHIYIYTLPIRDMVCVCVCMEEVCVSILCVYMCMLCACVNRRMQCEHGSEFDEEFLVSYMYIYIYIYK